jgi:hypothetical protein
MMRLFSLKQAMIGSDKPYKGIKLHMLIHFIDSIAWWGAPKVFDMVRFEKAHGKFAKAPFKKVSKRLSTIMEDMMKRLNRGRLIDMLFRLSDISVDNPAVRNRRVIDANRCYQTDADIEFEPGYNSSPQHLHFNTHTKTFNILSRKIPLKNAHLHPFLSLSKLTSLLQGEQCPYSWRNLLKLCIDNVPGYVLCLHKCIKFDGRVQGIPVTHIYCSTTEEYGGGNTGQRFDWVELNMEDFDPNSVDNPVYPTTFGQVCAIVELKYPGNLL